MTIFIEQSWNNIANFVKYLQSLISSIGKTKLQILYSSCEKTANFIELFYDKIANFVK